MDVANQRVKVTLFQLLRRRVFIKVWQLLGRDALLAGRPRWARRLALTSQPTALKVLDGLMNPVTGECLPLEVRDRYLVSRKEGEIWDELSDDDLKRQKAKDHERKFFWQIMSAQDLAALLRFGIESSQGGECDEEEVNTLAQQIWQLYSRDIDGNDWSEVLPEDHSDQLDGGGGNHVRSVVRHEMRPIADRLLNVEKANTEHIMNVEKRLEATEAQLAKVIGMLEQLTK